ncbi:hypothetical protein L21SP2_0460 [Salinispira pacifica]|uniref:Uncharacterized protein n=1 Tax=Salinispira pacifica TaxID=1307761 RepID=V5WDN1_9SPIO|nr:hypothetical protein L21SP2_0460 [Salinispira pacifica]
MVLLIQRGIIRSMLHVGNIGKSYPVPKGLSKTGKIFPGYFII